VLESILNETASNVTAMQMVICTVVSLILGMGIAGIHRYRNKSSQSFLMTLTILPMIVQMIIMMVNGNLGTGVAVMGAFGLVRFRSMPGDAREINSIFLAMAVGLANGMGYIGIAVLLVLVAGIMTVVFLEIPDKNDGLLRKELKVTIPEDLDYTGIFDDIFTKYTKKAELVRVKTVNMGSLYELCYQVELKGQEIEKAMLDEIRCRNGNLTVVCGRRDTQTGGL
jgi:hypothetical protein